MPRMIPFWPPPAYREGGRYFHRPFYLYAVPAKPDTQSRRSRIRSPGEAGYAVPAKPDTQSRRSYSLIDPTFIPTTKYFCRKG
jgi:hypothetical protein